MLDLYLLLTPIFALFSFLALLNLKFALAQPKHQDLSNYQPASIAKSANVPKQLDNKQNNCDIKQQNEFSYFHILRYLFANFTLAQICLVRRSTNKIPLFFTISSFGLSSIFIKTQKIYFFSFIGILVTISYILIKIVSSSRVNQQKKQSKLLIGHKKVNIEQKRGQKCEIIMTSISLLANLVIIQILYKNTSNTEILVSTYNFLIIFALDSFIIKPIILSLTAFPLKFWAFTQDFLNQQNQIFEILRGQRVLKKQIKKANKVLERANNTTSNTENIIQIQPCVNYDLHGNNIMNSNSGIKEVSKCSLNYKKDSKMQESQSSLVKYINYPFKTIELNTVGSKVCNLKNIQLDEGLISNNPFSKKELVQFSSIKRKRNKLYSEKVGAVPQFIYEESGLPKNITKKEQEYHLVINESINTLSYHSAKKSSTSKQNQSTKKNQQNKVTRFSIQRKNIYHSNQKPQSIIDQQNFNNSCVSGFNYTTKNDLLKIREDKNAEDLEQIDMNSPERRKNKMIKLHVKANQQRKTSECKDQQREALGGRKVFKKYSLDPNSQIMKKVVEKNYYEKNSAQRDQKQEFQDRRKTINRASEMSLSRKSDVFTRFSNDSRIAKSVKRTNNNKGPIVRQNDENKIPQFVIQDFTC